MNLLGSTALLLPVSGSLDLLLGLDLPKTSKLHLDFSHDLLLIGLGQGLHIALADDVAEIWEETGKGQWGCGTTTLMASGSGADPTETL